MGGSRTYRFVLDLIDLPYPSLQEELFLGGSYLQLCIFNGLEAVKMWDVLLKLAFVSWLV